MLYRLSLLLCPWLLWSCAQQQYVEDPADGSVVSSPLTAQVLPTEATVQVPFSPLAPDVLAAQQDVWHLIRDASYLQIPPQLPAVQKEIRFYADKQKFFDEVAQRAEPYLFHIVTELQRREMPVELALLPVIESSYNPAAQGNGPTGLWQMVPQTARNFGLTVKPGYDGRKDALASTDAVLDYLQHLYEKLDNDWFSAVAAYNTGEGRIEQAVKRNKAKNLPTDFWHLKIPSQQTKSVPRWLAIIEIVKNPARYGVTLPVITPGPKVGQSRIAALTDLRAAARAAGISLAELQRLNPAFRQTYAPAGQSYSLILPYQQLMQFEQQKTSLKPVTLSALPEKTVKVAASQPTTHKVKAGESLGGIAARYQTSIKVLKQINRLKADTLQIGQSLQLPTANTSQVATVKEQKASSSRKTNSNKTANRSYQVAAGDSLWTIADKHQVSVDALRRSNGLSTNAALQIGQRLQIPSAAKSNTVRTHTIKPGDSLDRIARQYELKLKDLLKFNGLKVDSTLKPGQRLQLEAAR